MDSAAPVNHWLRCLALCMSVVGVSLMSAAGVAVSQASLPAPNARLRAPIGHRQPRPSDLPPNVQRAEQFNPPSAQTQPRNQTRNVGAWAANVPVIDFQKGCQEAEKDMASIDGLLRHTTLGTCLKQEQDARQEIINNWTKYPTEDRQKCINTTRYLPSYVEWLTCLEIYRDVKNIKIAPKNQVQTTGAGHREGRRP
jgi:hypothetical protein